MKHKSQNYRCRISGIVEPVVSVPIGAIVGASAYYSVRLFKDHWKLAAAMSVLLTVIAILLVTVYIDAASADPNEFSIINLLQQLNGLLSMPILSAFIVGLVFRNVGAGAAMTGVLSGTLIYAGFTFVWTPLHYIHLMLITLIASITISLVYNRLVLGNKEEFVGLPR